MKLIGFLCLAFIAIIVIDSNEVSKRSYSFYEDDTPIPLNDVNLTATGANEHFYNLTGASIVGLSEPAQVQPSDDGVVLFYNHLNVTGQYWTDGVLLVLFPLFGNGDFYIEAINVTINATGTPSQYDMFFFVSDIKVYLQNYVGGGLMSLVADAIRIPPIIADLIFQGFEPNIKDILNTMLTNYNKQ